MTFRPLLAATAAIASTGCIMGDFGPSDRFQSDFHNTYELRDNGRVDAESFNGAIEIDGWDQNKVEISGTKYGASEAARDMVKIEIHNTPDSIEIRAVKPSMPTGNTGARFTLHVPRKALVDHVSTSNGSIKIRDVAGAEHLRTSNGSVTLNNVSGEVDAHTSNGSIDAESIRGAATLRSSNGHIRAENIDGALDAETSNSGIEARLDSAPSATTRLATSNGSVDLTLGAAPRGDIRIQTRNNGITLRLPANASAHLVADTSNGSIRSDFDLSKSERDEKHHLDGVIGSGGPTVQMSTSNSTIRILKDNGN